VPALARSFFDLGSQQRIAAADVNGFVETIVDLRIGSGRAQHFLNRDPTRRQSAVPYRQGGLECSPKCVRGHDERGVNAWITCPSSTPSAAGTMARNKQQLQRLGAGALRRRDEPAASHGHVIGRIVRFVLTCRDAVAGSFASRLQHNLRGSAFGGAICVCDHAGSASPCRFSMVAWPI
jgi:hypothetical protein